MKTEQKLLVLALVAFAAVVASLYWMASISAALILGFLLAYLCRPLVDWMEGHRISRVIATCTAMLMLLVVGILIGVLFLPLIQSQMVKLMLNVPQILEQIQTWASTLLPAVAGDAKPLWDPSFLAHWKEAGAIAKMLFGWLLKSGSLLGGLLATVLLTPIVLFYTLRDWHRIVQFFKRILPAPIAPRVTSWVDQADQIFSVFIHGQLLLLLLLAVIYSVGLSLAGLDTALAIGVLAGALSIIPYVGAVVGFLLSGIAWFFQAGDTTQLFYIGSVFLIVPILEMLVLAPYFVEDRLGLHPLAVLFALLIGGQSFGIAGMLISLPVAAFIVAMIRNATPPP